MKLLVSNDDGIFSPGIRSLANTLATAGHDVTVVCPDRERSATGHGLTMHKPIRAEVIETVFDQSIQAWACSGNPADCVKLALDAILETPPDLVLSGINQGANLGTDVLYSGTVSAAMEGVLEGITSIAFSLCSFSYHHFQPAADFARALVHHLGQRPLPLPLLLNVNVPPVPAPNIKGCQTARLGMRRYRDIFEKRVDPRGKTYYWLAGEVLEDVDFDPVNLSVVSRDDEATDQTILSMPSSDFPLDTQAIKANCITITPLQYDLTAYGGLAFLQQWQGFMPDGFKP
jgi:5'-nucleotidase